PLSTMAFSQVLLFSTLAFFSAAMPYPGGKYSQSYQIRPYYGSPMNNYGPPSTYGPSANSYGRPTAVPTQYIIVRYEYPAGAGPQYSPGAGAGPKYEAGTGVGPKNEAGTGAVP
ncbi:hypothetical protein PMAYCL1PPCAC_19899, partial [Pristionchus mayeri]